MSVPELRFPEFEGEWGEKKLGDIGTFKNGVNKDKSDFGQGVPFINLMDVFGKNSISESKFDLVNATPKELKESNLLKGDVLFIRSSVKPSGVGLTAVINENLENTVYSGFLIRFREKEKIFDHNFKKYCFYTNKFRNSLMRKSSTSANTNINQESLNKLEIQIPSLSEQEKIASFLSSVDEKIEKLEKKLELWEAYKKGMMQKIFSQELRFKDENGEDYPDWEEKKLSEIAECLDNMRKPLNSNDRLKMQGDIPYYGANGIVDYVNDYIFDEPLVLLAEDGGNFEDFQNKPIAQLIFGKSWVNNHAHVLRNRSEITINFLFYSLVHKDIRKYINGTSRSKLNKKDMLSILLNLPNLIEQDKIIKILSVTDEKINLIKQEIKLNNKFKKGLLQKMFC